MLSSIFRPVFSSIGAKFGDMRRAGLKPKIREALLFLYLNQDISGVLKEHETHKVLRHAGEK